MAQYPTSVDQGRIFGRDALPDILEWISRHLDPPQVFTYDQLVEYLVPTDRGHEVLNRLTAIEGVYPEMLFSEEKLDEWARRAGYVRAEPAIETVPEGPRALDLEETL